MGVEFRHYLLPGDHDYRPSAPQLLGLVGALRREGWIVDPEAPGFDAMVSTLTARYEEDERVGLWEPPRGLRRLFPRWRTLRRHTPFSHEYHRPYGDAKRSGVYARTQAGRLPGERVLDEGWLVEHQDEPVRLTWPVPSLALSGLRYPVRPRPYEKSQTDRVYYEIELHWCADFVYPTSELIEPFEESPTCGCGQALEYEPVAEHPDPPFCEAAIRRTCPGCGARFRPDTLVATVHDAATGAERKVRGGAVHRFALKVDCGKWVPDGPVQLEEDLLKLCRTTLGQGFYEISDGSF